MDMKFFRGNFLCQAVNPKVRKQLPWTHSPIQATWSFKKHKSYSIVLCSRHDETVMFHVTCMVFKHRCNNVSWMIYHYHTATLQLITPWISFHVASTTGVANESKWNQFYKQFSLNTCTWLHTTQWRLGFKL